MDPNIIINSILDFSIDYEEMSTFTILACSPPQKNK